MQNNQLTLDDLQKAIDRVQAVNNTPPEYIFYVIQPWIDAAPEYFYQDKTGQWWFETPFTCKIKTMIIPQRFNCDYGILVDKSYIEDAIWRVYNDL